MVRLEQPEALELLDVCSVTVDDGLILNEIMTLEHDQPTWRAHQIDLAPWAGERIDVMFRLITCCTEPGPNAWYIDDAQLVPIGIFGDGSESGNLTGWSSSQ
jgi:hypothetical protein